MTDVDSLCTGATRKRISKTRLAKVLLPQPSLAEQEQIIHALNARWTDTQRLDSLYRRKLQLLAALKRSILHKAFTGELTTDESIPAAIPFPTLVDGISTTDLHAGVLAMAYRAYEAADRMKYFGHVTGEKVAHMTEAFVGLDLGREPVQDPAGPNDYPHLKKVEHRARMAGFFSVKRCGQRYELTPLGGFDRLIERVKGCLGDRLSDVEQLIQAMLPMDSTRAEIFATVYAAWNNLLLDGRQPTDEEIVSESRENWHPDKLGIPRERFFRAIQWMRANGFVPLGRGKRVSKRPA